MLIAAVLLSVLGIVVLYSTSQVEATEQAIFAIVGVAGYLGISRIDYKLLGGASKFFYWLILTLLLGVFLLGVESRGSIRWIPLGFVNIQPSEFAKPVMILALAYFWLNRSASWGNILTSFLMAGSVFGLIFLQPDLGTALTVAFIWLAILFVSEISWRKMLALVLVGMLLLPLSWGVMRDYQRERITTFLFPSQDSLGRGFHVIQSTIAVGSGELFGRGLGRGTQSRLQFLPEYQTDFMFAFIAEELGLFGSLLVLSLYGVIFFVGVKIIYRIDDSLGQRIVVGVLAMMFFQISVNIGMNIGIMPVTGITLPLLSYGGSSMVATFLALGLMASVGKVKRRAEKGVEFSLLE